MNLNGMRFSTRLSERRLASMTGKLTGKLTCTDGAFLFSSNPIKFSVTMVDRFQLLQNYTVACKKYQDKLECCYSTCKLKIRQQVYFQAKSFLLCKMWITNTYGCKIT